MSFTRTPESHRRLALATPEALLAAVRARFATCVHEAARRASALGRPALAWTSMPIPAVDPVDLFARVPFASDATLWCRPDEDFALIGIGGAWAFTASGDDRFRQTRKGWQALLGDAVGEDAAAPGPDGAEADGAEADGGIARRHRAVGPVALGGFSFSSEDSTSLEWIGFPVGSMVLPRVSVVSHGGASWLTLAVVLGPDGAISSTAGAAVEAELDASLKLLSEVLLYGLVGDGSEDGAADDAESTLGAAEIQAGDERPESTDWKVRIAEAARTVRQGALKKVVLARGLQVRGAGLDPVAAVRHLSQTYPTCTVFAVVRGERCFFGATPERLVRVEDRQVSTMALAGSAPRGEEDDEDRRLGAMLLASAKDRVEHAVVVEAMREALAETCASVTVGDQPVLLKFSNVQHLYTPLTATLQDHLTVLDLVERLHPTPAVGGVPRDAALAWIREHEGMDRGWYAGPVGWMNAAGEGEFAVAIRSALIHGDRAWLYAGCGIMGDSDPEEEYAESWLKLRPILSALGRSIPERPADMIPHR